MLGQHHQLLGDALGLLAVVDVREEVADTVQDDKVRLQTGNGLLEHLQTLLPTEQADVEGVDMLGDGSPLVG